MLLKLMSCLCNDRSEETLNLSQKSNVDLVNVTRQKCRFNEGGEGTGIALVPDLRTSLFRRDPRKTASDLRGLSQRTDGLSRRLSFFRGRTGIYV